MSEKRSLFTKILSDRMFKIGVLLFFVAAGYISFVDKLPRDSGSKAATETDNQIEEIVVLESLAIDLNQVSISDAYSVRYMPRFRKKLEAELYQLAFDAHVNALNYIELEEFKRAAFVGPVRESFAVDEYEVSVFHSVRDVRDSGKEAHEIIISLDRCAEYLDSKSRNISIEQFDEYSERYDWRRAR